MRERKLVGGAAALAMVVLGGTAFADPIPLGGYAGSVTIKFADYESFTGTGALAAGADNFGIFEITSILGGANIIYQAPITPSASTPLLVGLFSGINITKVDGAPPNENTENSGGVFSVYADTTTLFGTIAGQGTSGYANALCPVDTQCYHDITDQGFDNILNISLVPGANTAATSSTLYGSITVASPLTGAAEGFGDITGGSDAGQFTKSGLVTALGTLADLFIQDDFCQNNQVSCPDHGVGNWFLASEDPITGSVVPEPGSLAILGSALVGFGSWVRRRKRKQQI